MDLVEKSTIIQILNLFMPDVHEELRKMDKNGGWIKLPEHIINFLIHSKINWWQLYENEGLLKSICATILFEDQEAKKFFENLSKDKVYTEYIDLVESLEDWPIPTDSEKNEFLVQFKTASPEEQVNLLKPLYKIILGLISASFNYLALMVHGRSMGQLVSAAKMGDDNAFRCAVQIDRCVLRLDYFQERLLRAQFLGDQDFLDKLSYRIKSPILQTKIKYKTLLLTFAILDEEGYLYSLPHDELLNLCEEIGVYGRTHGIEDVDHLRKRLSDYKRLHRNSKSF